MPTDQHAQPPSDDRPPPCDCGGCREFRAIYSVARGELPLHERQAKREQDRRLQRAMEEAETTGHVQRLRAV